MAESKYLITKCNLVPNGCSLEKEYSIKDGAFSINYFESIESPSISMTLSFFDTDQVVSREGLTGGELIELTIKDGDEDEFKITKKHRMVVNAVTNVITSDNGQVATLECVTMESVINETTRLNQRFSGNISEIVEKILTSTNKKGNKFTEKKLFGPKTQTLSDGSTINKDRATNAYSFVSNLKHPFDTVQWLCPKTQSEKGFGFLFYENLDGYHFRSIDGLFDQDAYRYQKAGRPLIDDGKILEQNLDQSNDISMNLRLGMYANKTIYIDIENQTARVDDFNINKLKLRKPLKLMDGLEEHPTRLMLKASDVGVAQKGSKKDDTTPLSELDEYRSKTYIRNNLLFSQSFVISIPLNTKLRVGELIDVRLPIKKGDGDKPADSYGNDKTNDPSGTYLISELRHTMSGKEIGQTDVKLIRDVFTA